MGRINVQPVKHPTVVESAIQKIDNEINKCHNEISKLKDKIDGMFTAKQILIETEEKFTAKQILVEKEK